MQRQACEGHAITGRGELGAVGFGEGGTAVPRWITECPRFASQQP